MLEKVLRVGSVYHRLFRRKPFLDSISRLGFLRLATLSNKEIESRAFKNCIVSTRHIIFSNSDGINRTFASDERTLNSVQYEKVATETLESLTDYFEELIDNDPGLATADVTYGDGVLTVSLGSQFGTYVINKQTPNLQIWLSSPTSGPKRYDFIDSTWVYKHDNTTLHSLLDNEITKITKQEVAFSKTCLFGK